MGFNPDDLKIIMDEPEYSEIIMDVIHHPLNVYFTGLLKPKQIVVLGAQITGAYFAYCQAINLLRFSGHCLGLVDGQMDLTQNFLRFNEIHYPQISELVFTDSAAPNIFPLRRKIDLLHIACLFGWKDIHQLLDFWLPKLSDHAFIVIEGVETTFAEDWANLRAKYPSVAFSYGKSQGYLNLGKQPNYEISGFFNLPGDAKNGIEKYLWQTGELCVELAMAKHGSVDNLKILEENNQPIKQVETTPFSKTNEDCEISESKTRKLAIKLREFLKMLFPPNSFQFRVWNLFKKTIWVIRNEGMGNAIRAAGRKLRFKRKIIENLPTIEAQITPKVSPNFNLPELSNWYREWIIENEPDDQGLDLQRRASLKLSFRPFISVLTPVYDPPPAILEKAINSILDQTYDRWELCLVNGNSGNQEVSQLLYRYAKVDPRIKVKDLPANLGISGNTNAALEMADGNYVSLLDHDDTLPPQALYEVAVYLNEHPECEIIYSDEDRINIKDERSAPFFKPDWSPDLLQAFMYIGHATYAKKLVTDLHGFRSEYDFSQDYDLALRASEITQNIGHIPKILYHWRTIPTSAAAGGKNFARESNLAALRDAVKRRGCTAEVFELPTSNCVKYLMEEWPLVSIIIPTDDETNALTSVQAILEGTGYPNFEILLVINTNTGHKVKAAYIHEPRLKIIPFDKPYNFSEKCNVGVDAALGGFVLFLNDDVFPMKSDWLEWMVGPMQQDGVGAVAPKLVYANGTVQHAGLVSGVRGFFGTAFHTFYQDTGFYFNLLQSPRTVSALSAACMVMRKTVFEQIHGFDAINTPIMHSDLDLCYKIRDLGLRLVYTPYTVLKHIGHTSLRKMEENGAAHSVKADLFMLKRWTENVDYDPYFPPNMRDYLYIDSPTRLRTAFGKQVVNPNNRGDILIQSHDLTFSGAPIIACRVAALLKSNNFFVTAISPETGELKSGLQKENIPLIIDPLILSEPNKLYFLLRNYDAVIANTIHAWKLVNYAKQIGKKVIWYIHESNYGCTLAEHNPLIKKALAQADLVIFPSLQTLNKYKNFEIFDNFIEIPHGIDDPEALVIQAPERVDNKIRVAIVGSIEPRKGQDILINAIDHLPQSILANFEFNIVGRPLISSYYEKLQAKTQSLPFVNWFGHVSPSQALQYISENDILLCSSRDETGPLVVFEAMGLGKTVISTIVGYVPEIIENGKNGFLFAGEDGKELADLLINIDQNRSQLNDLGKRARLTYVNKLQSEKFNDLFLAKTNPLLSVAPQKVAEDSENFGMQKPDKKLA